ncbi:hypothetical protein H311_00794, partial [Anncaliia algerae PRA109]
IKNVISPSLIKSLIGEIKETTSTKIETLTKTRTQPVKITTILSKTKTLTKTKIHNIKTQDNSNQTITNTIYKYKQAAKPKPCVENCDENVSTVYVFKDEKDC